ncbi:rotamase-domain-containing protein [Polyplosphaeria fusca]|uniref:Peptidyl-prolyl cis-trans isomerase n=1 Tax=Polyplosphaeria fusca TaxID=682080 RepID=A0A9P4QSN0_9PLEO|nr:rotamase-domain-containing protein [Polyplosphaeria fusca]
MSTTQEENGLPEGWQVRRSNTKNLPYYFNPATKDSRWEPPAGTDTEKLKLYMAKFHSSKVPSSGVSAPEGKIRAAHLLVKHRDSRRPASWREPKITRSFQDAQGLIEGYRERIHNGESLSELATTESDCSSASKGGDLWATPLHLDELTLTGHRGYFSRGDMQKEFEDAAFNLQKGELSDIVATASGLHLIQRLE